MHLYAHNRCIGEVRLALLLTLIFGTNFSENYSSPFSCAGGLFLLGKRQGLGWNADLICTEMNGCIHWNTHRANVRCRTFKLS